MSACPSAPSAPRHPTDPETGYPTSVHAEGICEREKGREGDQGDNLAERTNRCLSRLRTGEQTAYICVLALLLQGVISKTGPWKCLLHA